MASKPIKFSPREQEVYVQLVKGRTIPEIASHLELTVNTVKTHVKRVYMKTGTHKQVHLITQALKQQGCKCLERL